MDIRSILFFFVARQNFVAFRLIEAGFSVYLLWWFIWGWLYWGLAR